MKLVTFVILTLMIPVAIAAEQINGPISAGDWFKIVISIMMGLSVFIFKGVRKDIDAVNENFKGVKISFDQVQKSIHDLNVHIVKLVGSNDHNNKRIDDNKDEIKRLHKETERLRDSMHDLRNEMATKESIVFLLEKIKEQSI